MQGLKLAVRGRGGLLQLPGVPQRAAGRGESQCAGRKAGDRADTVIQLRLPAQNGPLQQPLLPLCGLPGLLPLRAGLSLPGGKPGERGGIVCSKRPEQVLGQFGGPLGLRSLPPQQDQREDEGGKPSSGDGKADGQRNKAQPRARQHCGGARQQDREFFRHADGVEHVPLHLYVPRALRGFIRAAASKAGQVLRLFRQLHADGGVELGRLQALGGVLQTAGQELQHLLIRKPCSLLRQRSAAGGKCRFALLQLRQTGAAAGSLRPLDTGAQGLQAAAPGLGLRAGGAQLHGLCLCGAQGGKLCLQLVPPGLQPGQQTGSVGIFVFQVAQLLLQRGGRRAFLAGGDKGAQPLLELGVARNGHAELPHEGRSLKHAPLRTAQRAAAVLGRQLRHGCAALRLIGAERAHGRPALRAPLDRDGAAVPDQVDRALHGAAVPRTVALLGGQILVFPRGALTRVDAIEHRQQEGAPRRFPGFVRQAQLVEPLMQGQRAVQLAEVCP